VARRRGPWLNGLGHDDRVAEMLAAFPVLELLSTTVEIRRNLTASRDAVGSHIRAEADGTECAASAISVSTSDDRPLFAHMRAVAVLDGSDVPQDRTLVL
jgi:hypothetical protein